MARSIVFMLVVGACVVAMFPALILANMEGDALYAFRMALDDPTNILSSWDATMENPCSWLFVTCNSNNGVIRLSLGNTKNLFGPISPQISLLSNLQYLELFDNKFNGSIPSSLGGLKNLVSLDLYQNSFTGPIPTSLGQLSKLYALNLNDNQLSGIIPESLTSISALTVLNLSNNQLSGPVPNTGSFSKFTYKSFQGNPGLCGPVVHKDCN